MTDTVPAADVGLPKAWDFNFGDRVRFVGTNIIGVVRGRSETEGEADCFNVCHADDEGIPRTRWKPSRALVLLEAQS